MGNEQAQILTGSWAGASGITAWEGLAARSLMVIGNEALGVLSLQKAVIVKQTYNQKQVLPIMLIESTYTYGNKDSPSSHQQPVSLNYIVRETRL